MSRIASRQDFEDGDMYTEYTDFPFFAERADFLQARFPTARTIVVAGCGYGYLVQKLRVRGISAWGLEVSHYALQKCQELLPEIAPFVLSADCTSPTAVRNALDQAGLQTADLMVSEEMLPCCDDEHEVRQMVGVLREVAPQRLHFLVCALPDPQRNPGVLWFSRDQWKSLVSPDLIYDVEKKEIL